MAGPGSQLSSLLLFSTLALSGLFYPGVEDVTHPTWLEGESSLCFHSMAATKEKNYSPWETVFLPGAALPKLTVQDVVLWEIGLGVLRAEVGAYYLSGNRKTLLSSSQ